MDKSFEYKKTENSSEYQKKINPKLTLYIKKQLSISLNHKRLAPEGYVVAQKTHYNPITKNLCIACYPLETKRDGFNAYSSYSKIAVGLKVDNASKAFPNKRQKNYTPASLPNEIVPEKEQAVDLAPRDGWYGERYARPSLELEFFKGKIYVRCYLAIAGRGITPEDKEDFSSMMARTAKSLSYKDIVQDPKTKEVKILPTVKLMNFGDPLRALTWVEDYQKNPEHKATKHLSPLIRSFLIPLENYVKVIQSENLQYVDRDRAPGQVRLTNDTNFSDILKPKPDSLFTFIDIKNKEMHEFDGSVSYFEVLSQYVTGHAISPVEFATPQTNSHQHARKYENKSGEKVRHRAFLNTAVKDVLEAQTLAGAYRAQREQDGNFDEPSSLKSFGK